MSVITEVKLTIPLRSDTPEDILNLMDNCLVNIYSQQTPTHPFFSTQRWRVLFKTFGYTDYDIPYLHRKATGYTLHIHADINYEDGEIVQLMEWLRPYIKGHKKKLFLGTRRMDQSDSCNVYLIRSDETGNN